MRTLISLILLVFGLTALKSFGAEATVKKPQDEKTEKTVKSTRKKTKIFSPTGPPPVRQQTGALSVAELQRLDEILEKDNHASVEDNVLLRLTHYNLMQDKEKIRDLQLDAMARKLNGATVVRTRPSRVANSGLRVNAMQEGPDSVVGGSFGSMDEGRSGQVATESSLMTTVGKPSYVSVLKRTVEVWDARIYVPPAKGKGEGKDKGKARGEVRLIKDVVGTGLRVLVKSATQRGIIMELSPYFHVRDDNGRRRRTKRIFIKELQSTVRAIPGKPFEIGGITTRDDNKASSIFSNFHEGGTRSTKIVVRARIFENRERRAVRPGVRPFR